MAGLTRVRALVIGSAVLVTAAAAVLVARAELVGGCAASFGRDPSVSGGSFSRYQPPTIPYVGPGGAQWRIEHTPMLANEVSRLDDGRWQAVDAEPLANMTFHGPGAVAADGDALLVMWTSGGKGETGPTHLALGDGRHWRIAGLPHADGYVSYADGVAIRTAHDGWAVGGEMKRSSYVEAATPPNYVNRPFALHLDGSGWHPTHLPAGRYRLSAVDEVSSDDVWAGGLRSDTMAADNPTSDDADYTPVMLHWNGSFWSSVRLPAVHGYVDQLVTTSADDIWAMLASVHSGPRLLHWDGTRWSTVALPDSLTPTGVVAGCGGLWVAGNNAGNGGELGFVTPDGRRSFRRIPTAGHELCHTGRLAGAPGLDTLWLETEYEVSGISDNDDVSRPETFH
jgi:hypothetical protein